MMKKQRILCLCMASLLVLSLTACNRQTNEQDSTPPTASVQPTIAPTPTPEPTPPIPYTDVDEDSPYYDAVVWAYENGIASDGSTFEPDSECTRGQVVMFQWRAKGSPEPQATESPFSDVSSADWFYKPALWAYEMGIAAGETFKPNGRCTIGEALTFMWRAEGKPAAAVYSSPMALAASGAYYERPVAWAENSGMFAGLDSAFDPSAICSRAELLKYLYCVSEEWIFTEEDKTVQAEYEQIINDAQLFEVHSSGLLYADYVDADGDGKVELLTIGALGDASGYDFYEVTATVYANIGGHAGKLCEETFLWEWNGESLSICKNDNRVFLRNTWLHMGTASEGDVFFAIENGAFEISESISISYASEQPEYSGITEAEYNALDQKYTGRKELLSYDRNSGISVHDRGLLPSADEYYREWIYPAVLNGDFSFFAGTYKCGYSSIGAESLTLNKDGTLEGGHLWTAINQKPISINVTATGIIQCVIIPIGAIGDFDAGTGRYVGETYDIYPIGVKFNDELYDGYIEAPPSDTGTGTLRIIYAHWGGTRGPSYSQYYKAP